MKLTQLLQYNIPSEIVRLWQERESAELLPVQEMAVKRHGLFEPHNLLIQAPTSSGKTFIGEMAAVHTALRRKKVVYLVPLKALAEEKFRDFQEKYAAYGIRVILSSRDHRDHDVDLESGNFSIAIVVYEKLAHLLVRRPERLAEIELVVADELEILSDPDRGADVEVLLTRILRANCRLVGLSAVVGEAEKLAAWMNAQLLAYEQRPVELRYGVLHEGVFRYRTYNGFTEGTEALVDCDGESNWETVARNVSAFAEANESCLVFVKAKHEAMRGAELLAQRVSLPAATASVEELRALEPTRARQALLDTLNTGVAFHSADLSPDERRIVEAGFRSGEIGVIVCTSTLAVGLNLPARNVFITADKWRYDSRFGMPWKAPILRSEYENMGGRAGRYGSCHAFGRSILVAASPFDAEALWRRYVEGEREGIEPQLHKAPLEDHVLRLVASRTCSTDAELVAFLETTLTGRWVWQAQYPLEEVEATIRAAVHRAMDAGAMARDHRGHLEATPLGRAVAAKGIGLATAGDLERWIADAELREWPELELILASAATADAELFNVTLTAQEYEHAGYFAQLRQIAFELNMTDRCGSAEAGAPVFEEVRRAKVALMLTQWIDETPLNEIEERFHTMTGQVLAAADQIAWLIDAAGAVAEARAGSPALVSRLRTVRDRVQYGLHVGSLALAAVSGAELSRKEIIELVRAGLSTPEAIGTAPCEALERYVARDQAAALKAWAAGRADAETGGPRLPAVPVLRVDDRQPGVLFIEGQAVRLQDKQYRLIQVLAESPGECVPYDRIYQAVWGESVVESNQMHFQKRKLLERIERANTRYRKIVRTVPKRGFVLNLAPDQVACTAGAGAA